MLTGFQAAAVSLLVVMAPATAAIAAAPTADGSATVDWGVGMSVAAKVWLLAHGVPIETARATFTLVPLGLTLLCAAILVAISQRFAAKAWGSWFVATVTYAACAGMVAAVTWDVAGGDAPLVIRAVVVALAIAAPSVAVGIWRAHGAEFGWITRIPEVIRVGLRLGLGTTALVVVAAAVTTTAWGVMGAYVMADAAQTLGADPVSGVALAVTQMMYAPVIVVWMIGWLTGVGFSVGDGNVFAPAVVATDTLPVVPLLGALPQAAGGTLVWAPVVIALLSAGAWWSLRRRIDLNARGLVATGIGIATVSIVLGGLMWVTSGAAGPGRLEVMGADALAVAAVGGALAAAGFVSASLAVAARRAGWSSVQRWARNADPRPLLDNPEPRPPVSHKHPVKVAPTLAPAKPRSSSKIRTTPRSP
jgi:hypothetical protein